MLVVMAILVALFIPAAGNYFQQAKMAKSVANLRQLVSGVLQYAGDNNGSFPPHILRDDAGQPYSSSDPSAPGRLMVTAAGGLSGFYSSWQDAIYPYIGDAEVFRTPSGADWVNGFRQPWPGYLYNADLSGLRRISIDGSAMSAFPRKLSEVRQPGKTVIFAEGPTVYNDLYGNLVVAAIEGGWGPTFMFPYNGKGPFAYLDGHIQVEQRDSPFFGEVKSRRNASPYFAVEFQ